MLQHFVIISNPLVGFGTPVIKTLSAALPICLCEMRCEELLSALYVFAQAIWSPQGFRKSVNQHARLAPSLI